VLPDWPPGTPATLCVAGPHAIPVSTAIRAGDARVLFALSHRRVSLARLRDDPACALCVLAGGVAFSVEGRAAVVRERLRASDAVAALELRAERVHDHLSDGRTEIFEGIRWRWREPADAERDGAVRAELAELAAS
jgi:hypothetical protein